MTNQELKAQGTQYQVPQNFGICCRELRGLKVTSLYPSLFSNVDSDIKGPKALLYHYNNNNNKMQMHYLYIRYGSNTRMQESLNVDPRDQYESHEKEINL